MTLHSGVCDTTPGDDGTIDHVTLVSEAMDSIRIDFTPNKGQSDSRYAPYPFDGQFLKIIDVTNLSVGTNRFRLVAANKTIGVGFNEFAFDIGADPETGAVSVTGFRSILVSENEYHPLMVRYKFFQPPPEEKKVKVDTLDGDRTVARGPGDGLYLANKDGSKGDVALAIRRATQKPVFDSRRNSANDPYVEQVAKFNAGFVVGFMKGGVELVAGTVRLAFTLVNKVADNASASAIFLYDYVFNPDAADAELNAQEKQNQANEKMVRNVALLLYKIATAPLELRNEIFIAIATNDRDKLQGLSEEYVRGLKLALMVISNLAEEYLDLDSYEQGKLFGRAAFEIVSLMAVFAKTGEVATIEEKVNFLEQLLAKLQESEIANDPQTAKKFADFASKMRKDIEALKKLKMCFVAGTMIWTNCGLKPIERIRPGDMVLSRDPITFDQCYQMVTDTFVTHPETLLFLRFLKADGSIEEIHCTAGHPFWSVGRNCFVFAAELKVDEEIALFNYQSATVIGKTVSHSSPHSSFTTYNFEVSHFHTYFVGKTGLWVHNRGSYLCQDGYELLKIYYKEFKGKRIDILREFGTFEKNEGTLTAVIDDLVNFEDIEAGNRLPRGRTTSDPGALKGKIDLATKGDGPSQAELRANIALRKQGSNVHWVAEDDVTQPDLLVNLVKHDVISPETKSLTNIGDRIAEKSRTGQAQNIILDLTRAGLKQSDIPADFVKRFVNSRIENPANFVDRVVLLVDDTIVGSRLP